MPVAWRIVKAALASSAFNGEGAFRFGGRWNSRGHRAVYCSGALSLAALETLVHLVRPVNLRYLAFRLEFEARLVEKLGPARLPSDWRSEPPGPSTMSIGDAWIKRSRRPILAVPSAIVPAETNFLLNPAHPDFSRIRIGKPEPFAFDPRLLD